MKAIDHELELTTRGVLATEDWAEGYSKAPKQHAQLIKNTAKLHRQVLVYFRDLANEASSFVDWYAYARAVIEQKNALKASANVQAYDVKVVVNNDAVNQSDQTFIKLVFDTLASTIALGADSMDEEFSIPVGLSSTSAIVQDLTSDQLANLVGMKVDKTTGLITPNANPAYSIDETTRSKIANSIKTSIQLGENQQQAVERLMKVIADPVRADMIARTETVRAYAEGRAAYAKQSNAVAKHWYDSNAIDECADNTAEGWIPAGDDFESGDPNEPAHPNCKCITLYSYDPADLE